MSDQPKSEPNPNTVELRCLRLWHVREHRNASIKAGDRRASDSRRQEYAKIAAFHARAIAALNSIFPAEETAEGDARCGYGPMQ